MIGSYRNDTDGDLGKRQNKIPPLGKPNGPGSDGAPSTCCPIGAYSDLTPGGTRRLAAATIGDVTIAKRSFNPNDSLAT